MILTDIEENSTLSTENIEGNNGILKHIQKRSPGISWKLLSDRLTNNRLVRAISSDSIDALVDSCVSINEDIFEKLKSVDDHKRYIGPSKPPEDETITTAPLPFPRVEPISIHDKHAVKICTKLRTEAAMVDESYSDAIRLIIADGDATDDANTESILILACFKYRTRVEQISPMERI